MTMNLWAAYNAAKFLTGSGNIRFSRGTLLRGVSLLRNKFHQVMAVAYVLNTNLDLYLVANMKEQASATYLKPVHVVLPSAVLITGLNRTSTNKREYNQQAVASFKNNYCMSASASSLSLSLSGTMLALKEK
jgi:hypothetical protein